MRSVIQVYLSEEEKKTVQKAAVNAGKRDSHFVRDILFEYLRKLGIKI
jgi:hypothetical protein